MAPRSHMFLFFIIIIIVFVYSISSCCSLEDDIQPNINNIHLYNDHDQETGYDSRAYPSQFLSSDGMSPDYPKVEPGISSYLEKLAAELISAKIVNVKSHGATGDGKSDDTKVCKCMYLLIYLVFYKSQ